MASCQTPQIKSSRGATTRANPESTGLGRNTSSMLRLSICGERVTCNQLKSIVKPVAQTIEVTPAPARSSSRSGSVTHPGRNQNSGLRFFRRSRRPRDIASPRRQRQIVGVAAGDVVADVRREAHGAVVEQRRPADEGDAAGGERAEVDGMAAVDAANRDGDMLRALGGVSRSHRPRTPSHQQ